MRLFKYYGEGEWVFNNLNNNQIFYNDFNDVNDPYDVNNGMLEDSYFEAKNETQIKSVKKLFNNMGYEMGDHMSLMLRGVFIDLFGVSCFTSRNDSILMWGHYGNGFKGICVEYDIPEKLYERLIEVKYDDIPLTVNSDLLSVFEGKHGIKDAKDIFSVKHSDWAYEKEWRVVGGKNGIEKLPADSMKSVYFGVKSTKKYREEVLEVLSGYKNINYFNMKSTYNSFLVEFEMIEESIAYMPSKGIDINEIYDKLLNSTN